MFRKGSFVFILAMSGCASNYWTHSDKKRLDYFQQDVYECQIYADNMTANQKPFPARSASEAALSGMLISMNKSDYVNRCLVSKGYYQIQQ